MLRTDNFFRPLLLLLVSLAATSLLASSAVAQSDGYVLFLSEYLYGDFYVASLGDVDRRRPRRLRPQPLRLPASFANDIELGNADVSAAGYTIVFGARHTSDNDWGIYTGTIDVAGRQIEGVEPLIQNLGIREEDPRFSWDGVHVVYKCDGDICIYPNDYGTPVVASECELWAPAFDSSKSFITYAKRCDDDPDLDRIWRYDLNFGVKVAVPNTDGGPDRFSQFFDDGRVVYSHVDSNTNTSSLWTYEPITRSASLFHARTQSDDDPYPDKHDPNHLAFIGWSGRGYDLFIYRATTGDSAKLTRGQPVLGPVLFR